MSRIAGETRSAPPTPRIDLSDDAGPDQIRRIDARFDNSDKFVTDRAVEIRITFHDLEICVADPGSQHTNQSFAARLGRSNIGDGSSTIIYAQGLHSFVEIEWIANLLNHESLLYLFSSKIINFE